MILSFSGEEDGAYRYHANDGGNKEGGCIAASSVIDQAARDRTYYHANCLHEKGSAINTAKVSVSKTVSQ